MPQWLLLRARAWSGSGPALGLPLFWWLAFVASCALAILFAPAAMVAVALLVVERERLVAALLRSVEKVDARGMVVGFLMVWPLLWLTVGGMTPGDDVLRHFTAWRHGHDYHRIYAHIDPRFPHESMWFGYEWLIGWLHRGLGLQLAIPVLQCLVYAAAAYSLWRVSLVLVPDRDDAWTWRLVVVAALLLTQLIYRIGIIRPEVVFTIWAMSALWMRPWAWLALGMLLQPLYWLALVYVPAAMLLQAPWRVRIGCALAVAATGLVFWLGYAGSAWLEFFWLVGDWMRLRLAPVGENESIFLALWMPVFVATLLLLVWRGQPQLRRDAPVLALLAWFLLPGQIRYLALVHLLMVVLLARSVVLPRLNAVSQLALWALVLAASAYGVAASGKLSSSFAKGLPHFKTLPSDAQLLTPFDQTTFLMPAEHPGIRSAPAMELGATLQPVQALAVTLSGQGRTTELDCKALQGFGFTHVVEKKMPATAPCLVLQEISNGWRLWSVRASQ
ncbi:MAG: hypothetical protein ABW190_00735 [Rhizobacter sp.]